MEALTNGLQPADILRLLVTNIVAFLIFVFLLRKWAWGPLIAMLDERKEKIRGDFATAEGKVAAYIAASSRRRATKSGSRSNCTRPTAA